jgi:hypothetical protein
VIYEKHEKKIKFQEKSCNFLGCVKCKDEADFLISDYLPLTSEMVF